MKILNIPGWNYYRSDKYESLNPDKCGKWMHFFKQEDLKIVESICKSAIENNIVECCKHTDKTVIKSIKTGVACFYLECDDIERHRKVITFFLENDLIARTKSGKLYNISFKKDSQTKNGEYGSMFKSDIRLENFIDLNTGEWI